MSGEVEVEGGRLRVTGPWSWRRTLANPGLEKYRAKLRLIFVQEEGIMILILCHRVPPRMVAGKRVQDQKDKIKSIICRDSVLSDKYIDLISDKTTTCFHGALDQWVAFWIQYAWLPS